MAELWVVKRVTHNKGKSTPGVDGAIWSNPAFRYEAIDTLGRRGYQPQPFRRVFIPKIEWKAQTARYSHNQRPRYAGTLPARRCFPWRRLRAITTPRDFDRNARPLTPSTTASVCWARKDSATWVLEGDIRGCFDNISHTWMLDHISTDREVLKKVA